MNLNNLFLKETFWSMVDLQCCVSFRYKIETFLYMVYIYPYNCIFCYIYIHTHTHTHTYVYICMRVKLLQSCPTHCSLWTVACQAPLSMGFYRQECWSGLPCPPPGNLPEPGIKPASLMSPTLADGFFTISSIWEAYIWGFFGIHIYTLLYTK